MNKWLQARSETQAAAARREAAFVQTAVNIVLSYLLAAVPIVLLGGPTWAAYMFGFAMFVYAQRETMPR